MLCLLGSTPDSGSGLFLDAVYVVGIRPGDSKLPPSFESLQLFSWNLLTALHLGGLSKFDCIW